MAQPGGSSRAVKHSGPVIRLYTLQASEQPFCTGHTWRVAWAQVPIISAPLSLPTTPNQKCLPWQLVVPASLSPHSWSSTVTAAHPGQSSYVVLVPVGDDDSLYLVLPGRQESGVWQDLLHPKVCEAAVGTA